MWDQSEAGTRASILICEGEIMLANELTRSLKEFRDEVVGKVSSGVDTVRAAEELKPDLLLTDDKPKRGIDKIEAAEQVNARFDIPIVYLTGCAEPDDAFGET